MFPGLTRYNTKSALGYSPAIAMYYVKGLDNGNASCLWRVWSTYENTTTAESDMHWDRGTGSYSHTPVSWRTNSSPSLIHPLLKINPGEKKIILAVTFIVHPNWKNASGQSSSKQKFQFNLLNPKVKGAITAFHTCFSSVVIFTPKLGLFSEAEAPK